MATEVVLFSEPRLWVSKLVSKLETGNWIHEKTSFKLLQQVSLRASITLNKNPPSVAALLRRTGRYSASEPAYPEACLAGRPALSVALWLWVSLFKSLARFLDSAALRSKWQNYWWLLCVLCGYILLCLSGFVAMSKLCKTNPIRRALPGNPKH